MWWRRSTPSLISQVKRFAESFVVADTKSLLWLSGATDERRLSRSGSTITAEIQGVIDACVKLTGMPDLTLSFMVSGSTGGQPLFPFLVLL